MAPIESVCVIGRTVSWGDCDPASTIYTPRVFDFACEALDSCLRDHLDGLGWRRLSEEKGIALPTVRADCTYASRLRPDDRIVLSVYLRKVGRSSVTFEVDAVTEDGRLAFRVTWVSCAVDSAAGTAMALPDWLRDPLLAYKTICDRAARPTTKPR